MDNFLKQAMLSESTMQFEGGSRTSKVWIKGIMDNLLSDDPAQQIEASTTANNLITSQRNLSYQFLFVDALVRSGAIERCSELLTFSPNEDLVFHVATLVNHIVTAGKSNERKRVVQNGVVPKLISLLKPPLKIAEQVLWCLGTLARQDPDMRDSVLEEGAMPQILTFMENDIPVETLRIVLWVVCSLCQRVKDHSPQYERVKECIPFLKKFLCFRDYEVLERTCGALCYITMHNDTRTIDDVINEGIIPKLVKLLDTGELGIIDGALYTIGNIANGNFYHIGTLFESGVVPHVSRLLTHPDRSLKLCCLWILYNLCRGPTEQIQAIINSGAMPLVIESLVNDDNEWRLLAMKVISNYIQYSSNDQIVTLIRYNFIKPFCDLLTINHANTLYILLESLQKIIYVAEVIGQKDKIILMIEDCGGLDKLMTLLGDADPNIQLTTAMFLNMYFSEIMVNL